MAKAMTIKHKKFPSFWETFSGLTTNTGWTIIYSPKTGRASLRCEDQFFASDISVESLKRIAENRHGVSQENWKKIS